MGEVIKQTIIGLAAPMVAFATLVAGASFVSQEALWRHGDFWFAFRLYVCVSLFIGYVRGSFTYLELTPTETKEP
jgi:hypothetical protein